MYIFFNLLWRYEIKAINKQLTYNIKRFRQMKLIWHTHLKVSKGWTKKVL